MKKTTLTIFAGTCALLAGCSTPQGIYVPNPAPQPPETGTPIRSVTQANANVLAINETSLKLRTTMGSSGSEAVFNRKLMERLAATVNGITEFTPSGTGDVQILISSSFEQKDADAGFYRVRCEQVTVAVWYQGKQIAYKVVEPRELPRKSGLQNAKDQYLNPVATAIAPFLQKELLNLSATELAVGELSFGLKNSQSAPSSVNVAVQVNRIKNALGDMAGVVNYALVSQDVTSATCTFRVVYRKKDYPQGLVNALNLKLANQ